MDRALAIKPRITEGLDTFRAELTRVLRGKESLVDTILASMLCSGHILLEDVPGVGKTTVIKAIARLFGTDMKRVQCTNDLLPSDIIGVQVYDSTTHEFVFHRGPIFSNILFVDELNRASPRTQSALLEAMGEGFVTVDRESYELPRPYLVFAAQNPSNHVGTYALPESQLDRFAVKLSLDYPELDKELEILSLASRDPLEALPSTVLPMKALLGLQDKVEKVKISDRVARYAQRFINATRSHEGLKLGVSTRGGVIWLRLSRARALLSDRDFVTPDDLIHLAPYCLSHRLIEHTGSDPKQIIGELLKSVDIEG